MAPDPDARTTAREELNAPFRPHRARYVTTAFAVGIVVLLALIALILPSGGKGDFRWYDRLAMVLVGVAIATFLMRFATTHATPSPEALTVRNLAGEHVVPWKAITGVRFSNGDPWVILRLGDDDQQPVMAVQRADGARGASEARRLATLVAYHQQGPSLQQGPSAQP